MSKGYLWRPEDKIKRKLYYCWRNMKNRCSNPNVPKYKSYGARGITVCKSWKTFSNFWNDMSLTYVEGLFLDRIDNNKGYSKENCRWVTMRMQQENRRNNVFFTFNNKTMTLPRWSEELGINRSTLEMRIWKYKWSVEKCLSTPVFKGKDKAYV